MNKQRRLFLNQLSLLAGITALNKPLAAAAVVSKKLNSIHQSGKSVTIYSTNDLHGNLGPVTGNMGGLGQVKILLKNQDTNGLLFDAGDFLNSSHSISHQKEVISAMNDMGYLAATLGNHELSRGQEALAALIPLMRFKLVNCNYRFDEALNKLIYPYTIIKSGNFKIGITGVGHRLNGVYYNDAIKSANHIASILKQNEKCDLVICLSHLGYSQKGDIPDNQKLAKQSEHIDVIISGHNQQVLNAPAVILNRLKQEVIVSHAAWDGLMMGKIVIGFENGKQKSNVKAKNFIAGQTYGKSYPASLAELRSFEKSLVSA